MESVISELVQIMQYGFIQRAIIAGIFIALSCSVLGVFLVLKKYSFIGDGLAHVSFFAVALALLLNKSPLLVSLPIVIIASILILKLGEKTEIYGDSAIALVASLSVAMGVIIASISKGFNVDLFGYLFGSILTIKDTEVIMAVAVSIVILIVIVLFYNELFLSTFDQDFSTVIGLRPNKLNYILSVVTAITIVIGIKVVGTMLISSMIIFPAVTAMQLAKGFKQTIIMSMVLGTSAVIIGIIVSLILNIPTGATIVVVNGFVFFISIIAKRIN